MRLKLTRTFTVRDWVEPTLKKEWMFFQLEVEQLGDYILQYMLNKIDTQRHRQKSPHKDGTKPLSQSITKKSFTGMGQVGWGIGDIARLKRMSPYWYVLNYGKTVFGTPFIPGGGKFVPGSFQGVKPSLALKGGSTPFTYKDGTGYGMKPKTYRPINYIESAKFEMEAKLKKLLVKLRTGGF